MHTCKGRSFKEKKNTRLAYCPYKSFINTIRAKYKLIHKLFTNTHQQHTTTQPTSTNELKKQHRKKCSGRLRHLS